MASRFMLDTDIVSDLMRDPRGAVASRIGQVGEAAVCTSVVVAAELRYGAEKSGSTTLYDRVDMILSALEVAPLEAPVDRHYGRLRNALAARGTPIGPNDMLIAAHALAIGATLVTANLREFERVPGLLVENWLSA